MHLPKPPEGSRFEICPAGTHRALCYRFIDLGTQRYQHPGGPKDQHKVMISWELPETLINEGEFAGEPMPIRVPSMCNHRQAVPYPIGQRCA